MTYKRASSSRFTEYQLSKLNRFKSDPFIKGKEKELLAKNLGTTMTAVKAPTTSFSRVCKRGGVPYKRAREEEERRGVPYKREESQRSPVQESEFFSID